LEHRPAGTSGIELSVLGIGAWSFGGDEGDYWGAQDQGDAEAVVGAALDAGINYFDSAEVYNDGRSEIALGRALGARRAEAIVGTKVSPENTAPDTLRARCEASLRRLGTDYIDIYMVHWPVTDRPVEEALEALAGLQRAGKIRAIGVSNFGVHDLGEAARLAVAHGTGLAIDQLYYNLLSRAIEIGVLPLCRQLGVGVIGYMPLQQGLLSGKYATPTDVPPMRARTRHFSGARPRSRHGGPGAEREIFVALDGIRGVAEGLGVSMAELSLAWAIARPGITCTLVGMRNPAQLAGNLAAARLTLAPEVIAELDRITAPVLQALGPDPDYWESPVHSRIH
jgi:aryl-alcohol dehydrogenase-like predicted oxidoreductase